MNMHTKRTLTESAALHLFDSAKMRTKSEGSDAPLELLAKQFGEHTAEVMKKLGIQDEKLKKLHEGMNESIATLEQKAARANYAGGGNHSGKSVGASFVESDGFANFLDVKDQKNARPGEMRVKASITTATTNAAGSAGAMASPYRDSVNQLPRTRLTVRDLLTSIKIEVGSVEYPNMLNRNLNAGMVAETATKPESDLQFELKTTAAKVIAHWMKASRQVLDDVPQLSSIIDSELLYGLALKEETQLLSGDGTGQNLLGMIPQATAYAAPIVVAGATAIDNVALAALQTSLALYEPDGVIVNPADWWAMRLTKDSQGRYIMGDPQSVVQPVLFGLPVVSTPAISVDKFLVGAFRQAATIYDRWEARIEVGYVDKDFINNMVTVLAEERLAFAVKNPKALTYGDFGNVT
ncbi:HK97 family phage major capsid protein [Rhizobium skierniewicense]|uniref:HK97 family phage major capsid protein n=1 Tax=Rhizobium skierniewicense TaxID=984260 RepID=A0A7W6C7Q5_9HYPH|nr:phage major capsid protein [Rhizobium skierniewicense]MBB3944762.1 HK97 family phage major capsid protein [Rhizobium skierniewicense]